MFNEFGYDGNLGFDTFEDPISNPRRSSINWDAFTQQAFALASHAISAFSGQNTGTQIGYNSGQGGVFAIQPNVQTGGYVASNPYADITATQFAGAQRRGVAEDAFGSLTSFISDHPFVIAGGALALYLLFKDPPRSRR